MKTLKTLTGDVLLMLTLVLSLAVVYARRGRLNEWLLVLPVILTCIFAVPLCQAFWRGIECARETMQSKKGMSPRSAFRSVLWPRIAVWFVLWTAYFALLEMCFFRVGGAGQLIISVPTTGLILLMFAACYFWAPRCRTLWSLTLLVVFTPVILALVPYALGWVFVALVGMDGYMGLGYLIVPPLFASVFLVLGAVGTWIWAWRKGDEWFRSRQSVLSSDASEPVRHL